MKNLIIGIWFSFLIFSSSTYALVQAISPGLLANKDKELPDVHIETNNALHIIIGPYFNYYFESEDGGNSFKVINEEPSEKKFVNLEKQKGQILYKLKVGNSQMNLYISHNSGKNWNATNFEAFIEVMQNAYLNGKKNALRITLVRRNHVRYTISIVLAFMIVFFFAFLVKIILKTKISLETALKTVIFYAVILVMPIYITPQFVEIFKDMEIRLPIITQFYCMISVSGLGILIYILAFTIFSPLVIEQIYQVDNLAEETQTASDLHSLLSIFSMAAFIMTFVVALFLPLIA